MSSKKDKKKKEINIDNRPKGVSKREFVTARKAEGRDPYAKFFSDPVADRKREEARRAEIAKTEVPRAEITPQEKAGADKFMADTFGRNNTSFLQGVQKTTLPQAEKTAADEFIARTFGKPNPANAAAQTVSEIAKVPQPKPQPKQSFFEKLAMAPANITTNLFNASPLVQAIKTKSLSPYTKGVSEEEAINNAIGAIPMGEASKIPGLFKAGLKKTVANTAEKESIERIVKGKATDVRPREAQSVQQMSPQADDLQRQTDIKQKVTQPQQASELVSKEYEQISDTSLYPRQQQKKTSISEAQQQSRQISQEKKSSYENTLKDNDIVPSVKQNIPNLSTPDAKKAYERSFMEKFQTVIQDSWASAKKLEKTGVKNTKNLNPSEAQELFSGRVGARLEELSNKVKDIDADIVKTGKNFDTDLKRDINKYLQATHAPERNAIHGDGAAGMTNKEASEALAEIGSSKASKEVQRIAGEIKKMNDSTLDILKDGGIIDEQTYSKLKATYKNHVPLNRIMPEDDDIVQTLTGGRGLNVSGTGIKRAKGSDKEVADILTNTYANLGEAIARAEKNRVNLATLEFARNNKSTGLFEEISPKIIGKKIDFNGRELGQKLADTPTTDEFVFEQITDPSVLKMKENGKTVYLKIHDEGLTKMYQAIGQEKLPTALKWIEGMTRYYASLATRFNPEFVLSNKIRDLQEAAINVSAKEGIGFKGAGKSALRDPASMLSVTEAIAGKDTPGARLYKQMQLDGGTTGGMSLSTRKNLELDVEAIEKLNRSNPRKASQSVLNGIENWGSVFEDSTRLSVYKTALDNGLGREQAALLAKNATLNFNKKGTAGPIINSMYMFANASIQGTTNTLKAMKNPKVAATVTTLVGSATFTANSWNDSVDPDWRDKVSEWDRNANLVVMLPSKDGGANYITLPVAWGVKPIKIMSDRFYEMANGKGAGVLKATEDILSAAIDAYNPIGGTDLISTLTPTPLDMPVDIARNKSWSGSNIAPDWMEGLPDADKYYETLKDSTLGKALIKGTSAVSEATGRRIDISPQTLNYEIDQLIGGGGRFLERSYDTAAGLVKGEEVPDKNIPFWNRFVKDKSEEEVKSSISKSERADVTGNFKQFKTGSEEQKQAIQDYLAELTTDEDREREKFILSDKGFDLKGVSTSAEVIKMKPTYKEIQGLFQTGKEDEALDKINELSRDDYTIYKRLKTQEEKDKNPDAPTEEQKFDSRYSQLSGSFQDKYKEMQKLRDQKNPEQMKEYVELEKRFAKELVDNLKGKTADEQIALVRPFASDKKLLEKIKEVRIDAKQSNTERDLSNAGVRDGEKAKLVWNQIKDLPDDEKVSYVKDLLEKKVISKEVLKQIKTIRENK